MTIEEKKISKRLQELCLAIYQENWANIRHNENIRTACLTAYTAILSGTLYLISQNEFFREYLLYLISFLLMFSIINLFIALKIEGIIEDYTNRNIKIVERLSIQEYAGLRVKEGVWRFIRHRYFFPLFYVIMTSAIFYFWIRVLF